MASSSTSCVPKSFKYDVFLSFRGEDTRTNFTDHLYDALKRKGIFTYKDDEAIGKGNLISDELIRSIEDSRLYIIVFSKNYASSCWCLDELVKIMECQKTSEHTAYPVFYDVEPKEVRWQDGAVGEAFSNLKNDEAAPKWKEALKEAADLAGRELKKTANGHEAEFIRIIIEDISKYLQSNNYCFDEKLVGMKTRVENVISYLKTDIDDVTMGGIKGIGGGGKTTLARVVFYQISFQFEGISFVENVREISKASVYGLASLQNIILKNVINDQNINVSSVYDGINMMKRTMNSRKVLLVLDDVDDIEQLKALAGDRSWFKKGSRIIITTRDENVLLAHRVNWVHNVNLLSRYEAICLFSRLAFERGVPIQGYEELSRQVVAYAGGLPLTITVLGSLLCDKDLDEWKDYLERLKKFPLEKTLQILELSFLNLPEDQKNIFLNVACMLKGWEKDFAIEALNSCGLNAKYGLKVLQQKSLITIYYDYYQRQCVGMHDHLEEMGKNIVRRKDPEEPEKHIRLWLNKEIKEILANDLGTQATQYMRLDLKEVNLEIVMKGIRKMHKLRFLHVYFGEQKSINFGGFRSVYSGEQNTDLDNQYLPNALQYLRWYRYPFCCLPNTFKGDNLVVLKMNSSKILRLWEGEEKKVLSKLKVLELRDSDLTIFDLGLIPKVEVLNLGGCFGLVQFHTHHGSLKLKHVNLSSSRLETVDLRSALDLEMLYLNDCYALVKLHLPTDGCLKLKYVDLSNSKRLDTVDLRSALDLEMLHLKDCYALEKLHLPTDGYLKLKYVDLSNSKRLDTVDLRSALDLEMLHLKDCYALLKLHLPADGCLKLTQLHCTGSKLANVDFPLSPNLETLNLNQNKDLVRLHMPGKCQNLRSLALTDSKLTVLNLGQTPNLEHLNLNKCFNLEELLMAEKCEKLVSLDISYSKLKNFDLGLTPNIMRLDLKDCNNLVRLHIPVGCLENLDHLVLSGCLWFTYFEYEKGPMHSTYKYFDLDQSLGLHLIAERLERCPLHPESTLPKFRFKCFFEHYPPSTRNLETLISGGQCACTNLETFSRSICELHRLIKLELEHYPEAPKNLSQLECLEELILSKTNMKHLPDDICRMKHLKILQLQSCWRLEKLPDDVGGLECLKRLTLSSGEIKNLPDSICKLKHLIYLKLCDCFKLENLPKDFGQLECLEWLYLSHTKIKHLPDSLCLLKTLKTLTLLGCSLLESLPANFGHLKCLTNLLLSSSKIKHLLDTFCMLKDLKNLNLQRCSSLEKLPEDLGRLECLNWLGLSEGKSLQDIPISICKMKHLKSLDVSGTYISHLPGNICSMKGLSIKGSRGLLESCGFTSEIRTIQYEDACCVTV